MGFQLVEPVPVSVGTFEFDRGDGMKVFSGRPFFDLRSVMDREEVKMDR